MTKVFNTLLSYHEEKSRTRNKFATIRAKWLLNKEFLAVDRDGDSK